MTEQYAQREINLSPAPRSITSTVAAPAGTISSEDEVVLIDTTASVYAATLPTAASAPGRTLTIINNAAVPLALTVAAAAGDAIVGVAVNPIVLAYGSMVLQSDGGTNWIVLSNN